MRRVPSRLDGPVLVEPSIHGDSRGFFVETYRENVLEGLGVPDRWVQDNQSRSARGVVRGMHYQCAPGQAKLVRCARGRILDVLVDIRAGSPSFGEWEAFPLDDELARALYIPIGFAHGFVVLSDVADVVYKCSSYYEEQLERGFAFDDPDVGIAWPEIELSSSERDRSAPRLRDLRPEDLYEYAPAAR